jgi:hypothetical protein
MRKITIFSYILLWSLHIYGQDEEPIIIKKGTKLLDYFSIEDRYLFPDFKSGKILLKTNVYTEKKLNYNYLNGEIEFLEDSDTLIITNKKDIKLVIIAQDTLFYDKGYILQLNGGPPKIGKKEFIEFKEMLKKDPYGLTSPTSSTTSHGSLPSDGNYNEFRAMYDMEFGRTKVYYISNPENDFVLLTKKVVLKMFPKNKEEIKSFLKSNKIKFDSEEDLLKLAAYLETL